MEDVKRLIDIHIFNDGTCSMDYNEELIESEEDIVKLLEETTKSFKEYIKKELTNEDK